MGGFINADDLVDAISEKTFMALYDDGNTGDVAAVKLSRPVKAVLLRAHAQTMSYLPRPYAVMPPEVPTGIVLNTDKIPVLLKDAELRWATIYSYRRHKEYVRTYSAEPGGSLCKEAEELMDRIAKSEQRIAPTDNPPETTPHNVHAKISPGADEPADDDGTPNQRFGNMGDFI